MHRPAVINPHAPAGINPHVDQAVYFLHKQQQMVQSQMQSFTRQNEHTSEPTRKKMIPKGKAYSDKQSQKLEPKTSPNPLHQRHLGGLSSRGRRTGSFGGSRTREEMLEVDMQDFEEDSDSSSRVTNNKSVYSSGGNDTQASKKVKKT